MEAEAHSAVGELLRGLADAVISVVARCLGEPGQNNCVGGYGGNILDGGTEAFPLNGTKEGWGKIRSQKGLFVGVHQVAERFNINGL